MSNPEASKRDFIKKAVYITPAILTLTAMPAFVKAGSGGGNPSRFNGQLETADRPDGPRG